MDLGLSALRMTPAPSGLLSLLAVIAVIEEVGGLQLLELKVPRWPNRGENAELLCQFDTESAKLYSVKWYKDEFEFYRYMPDNKPVTQVFPVSGVSIDENKSDTNRVTLTGLSFSSSGSYRCEVSTEAPNFETIFKNHNMTVLAYPSHGPVIEGMLETYAVHDAVAVNCSTAPSNPAPKVNWYINDLKADDYLVDVPEHPVTYPDNTFGSWATLKFILQRQHFLGPGKQLSLKCEAEVPPLQPGTIVREARLAGALNEMLAQQKGESGGGALRAGLLLLVLAFALLVT